mmetsp:Transcript_96894/g.269537  ORF Transcript_96894/g.269537 Transcript_96894/m.269537 type:complete len:357 (+) Transcript_96894:426-1496(+)
MATAMYIATQSSSIDGGDTTSSPRCLHSSATPATCRCASENSPSGAAASDSSAPPCCPGGSSCASTPGSELLPQAAAAATGGAPGSPAAVAAGLTPLSSMAASPSALAARSPGASVSWRPNWGKRRFFLFEVGTLKSNSGWSHRSRSTKATRRLPARLHCSMTSPICAWEKAPWAKFWLWWPTLAPSMTVSHSWPTRPNQALKSFQPSRAFGEASSVANRSTRHNRLRRSSSLQRMAWSRVEVTGHLASVPIWACSARHPRVEKASRSASSKPESERNCGHTALRSSKMVSTRRRASSEHLGSARPSPGLAASAASARDSARRRRAKTLCHRRSSSSVVQIAVSSEGLQVENSSSL